MFDSIRNEWAGELDAGYMKKRQESPERALPLTRNEHILKETKLISPKKFQNRKIA